MWGLYTCSLLLSDEWLDPEHGTPLLVQVRLPAGTDIDATDDG
jgi:hypothetical protein